MDRAAAGIVDVNAGTVPFKPAVANGIAETSGNGDAGSVEIRVVPLRHRIAIASNRKSVEDRAASSEEEGRAGPANRTDHDRIARTGALHGYGLVDVNVFVVSARGDVDGATRVNAVNAALDRRESVATDIVWARAGNRRPENGRTGGKPDVVVVNIRRQVRRAAVLDC